MNKEREMNDMIDEKTEKGKNKRKTNNDRNRK